MKRYTHVEIRDDTGMTYVFHQGKQRITAEEKDGGDTLVLKMELTGPRSKQSE